MYFSYFQALNPVSKSKDEIIKSKVSHQTPKSAIKSKISDNTITITNRLKKTKIAKPVSKVDDRRPPITTRAQPRTPGFIGATSRAPGFVGTTSRTPGFVATESKKKVVQKRRSLAQPVVDKTKKIQRRTIAGGEINKNTKSILKSGSTSVLTEQPAPVTPYSRVKFRESVIARHEAQDPSMR